MLIWPAATVAGRWVCCAVSVTMSPTFAATCQVDTRFCLSGPLERGGRVQKHTFFPFFFTLQTTCKTYNTKIRGHKVSKCISR